MNITQPTQSNYSPAFNGIRYKQIPAELQKSFENNILMDKVAENYDVFVKAVPKRTMKDPLHSRAPKNNETCKIVYGIENYLDMKGVNIKSCVQKVVPGRRVSDGLTKNVSKMGLNEGLSRLSGHKFAHLLRWHEWGNLDKINKHIKGNPEKLREFYLKPNVYGNIFIHNENPILAKDKYFYSKILDKPMPDKLVKHYDSNYDKINNALKDYPDMLAEMYLTPSSNGSIFAELTGPKQRTKMINALKDQPETLIQIYSKKCDLGTKLVQRIDNPDEISALRNALGNHTEGKELLNEINVPKPRSSEFTLFDEIVSDLLGGRRLI